MDVEINAATKARELTHWARHKSRKFGNEGYAREEQVAELGCAILCSKLRISWRCGRTMRLAYIGSRSVLADDKRTIFSSGRSRSARRRLPARFAGSSRRGSVTALVGVAFGLPLF